MLQCSREVGNAHALYAVKVMKAGSIFGHLPCTIKKQETAIVKLYIIRIPNKTMHNAPLVLMMLNLAATIQKTNEYLPIL